MSSPKILLYKHKTYSDGSHPIIIQIVRNGKPIRKVIAKCNEKDWLPSKLRVSTKVVDAPRINNEIEIALREFGLSKGITFFGLFEEQIEKFKLNNQVARYNINSTVLANIKEFDAKTDFDRITENYIYRLASFLKEKKRNSDSTVKEKMNVLKALLRIAKKQKLISENPIEEMRFSSTSSIKSKLTIEEIKKLATAELVGKYDEARDIFLACIFLRGARVGDVLSLTKNNIIDQRIIYREIKTGKKHNIGIVPDLQSIIEKWIGKSKYGYIFTFLETKKESTPFEAKLEMKNAISKLIRYLKVTSTKLGIDKNVTTHTARHTFSKIANQTIKDTTVTKELIGHSSLAIHEKYISDIADDIAMDEYADKVYDKLK